MAVGIVLAGSLFVAACDTIREPEVSVILEASSAMVMGTAPVQLFATVTEDGVAQTSTEVLFSTSRGTFSGGLATESALTDTVGLAVVTLTLSDGSDVTPVEVTATAVAANVMTMKTLPVESGGGR